MVVSEASVSKVKVPASFRNPIISVLVKVYFSRSKALLHSSVQVNAFDFFVRSFKGLTKLEKSLAHSALTLYQYH